MSEKMREEFEARFPIPMYVFWCDQAQHYMNHGNPLGCLTYRGQWEGWQASRESLVIELPNPLKDMDISDRDITGMCAQFRKDEKAIEAAGLKVKP